MTTARKIRFTGDIVAVSPLTISTFGKDVNKDYPGIPMLTVVEESAGKSLLPTIPGYNFKGALRRRAIDVVRDALAKAGVTDAIDLDTYYLNALGGVKGTGSEDVRNILRMRALREANPILGLFGAALPHFMHGCLSVSFATTQPEFYDLYNEKGMRIDDVRRRAALLDELAGNATATYAEYVSDRKEVREQKSKVESFAKKLAEARKAGDLAAKAALEAEQKAEQKKLDKLKDDAGAQIMRPIPRAGVTPGSQFTQTMTLASPTDAELGLMLASLKRFAANCRLGGLESAGFGVIRAAWTIEEIDLETLEHKRLGHIRIGDCEYEASLDHPTLAAAVAAWGAFAAEPTKIALSADALKAIVAAA
jgi:CRISPR type IV-associated protein Csf2